MESMTDETIEETTAELTLNAYEPVWVSLPVVTANADGVTQHVATIDIGNGNLVAIVDLPTRYPNTRLHLTSGLSIDTNLGRNEILDQIDRLLRPDEYADENQEVDGGDADK